MAISFTAAGAYAAASPSSPVTISGATLGVGDIYLFLYAAGYANQTADLSVTINGVSAAMVGSVNVGSDVATVWVVTGNAVTTGNIVLTASLGWLNVSANWFLITGEGTPVLTNASSDFSQADPQGPVTGTVLTSGLAVIGEFAYTVSGGTPNPISWAGATTAGSTTEAFTAGGNNISCSMATQSAAGGASVTSAGTTNNTSFAIIALLMLAFPASGSGGGIPIWPIRM